MFLTPIVYFYYYNFFVILLLMWVPLSPILFNLAIQKVIHSIKVVPRGIKIGKEKFNYISICS